MNTNEIVASANDISLETGMHAADAGASKFCTIWPQAKQGLEMLREIIKNPIAKGAISVVIAAGDAVASRICN